MSLATWVSEGYRQRMIWFWEYPCVLTSSLAPFDHARLQTWEPVSIDCRGCPVIVFQNRMVLSAVPPPEARIPCCTEETDHVNKVQFLNLLTNSELGLPLQLFEMHILQRCILYVQSKLKVACLLTV